MADVGTRKGVRTVDQIHPKERGGAGGGEIGTDEEKTTASGGFGQICGTGAGELLKYV